jgi:hypothetical protein
MGDLFCDDEETFSSRWIGLAFFLRHLYDLTGRSEVKASEILNLISKVNKEWGGSLLAYSPCNSKVFEEELKRLNFYKLVGLKYISRKKDTDILITLNVDNLRDFYSMDMSKYISSYSSDLRKTLEHVLRKEGKLK